MCGRYAASRGAEELVEELDITVDATGGRLRTTHNAAPTSQRAIVRAASSQPFAGERGPRELALAGWGLVPFFSKDAAGGARMINARSETVMDKPAYRRAIRRRRVLVPVDGWYEWQRTTGEDGRAGKVAHYMSADGGETSVLAGIAETWSPAAGSSGRGDAGGERGDEDPVVTFSILTRASRGRLAVVHDRTPLVVPGDLCDDWLDPGIDERGEVADLLAAALGREAGEGVSVVPVGRAVGNVRTDGPELVVPTGPPLP